MRKQCNFKRNQISPSIRIFKPIPIRTRPPTISVMLAFFFNALPTLTPISTPVKLIKNVTTPIIATPKNILGILSLNPSVAAKDMPTNKASILVATP